MTKNPIGSTPLYSAAERLSEALEKAAQIMAGTVTWRGYEYTLARALIELWQQQGSHTPSEKRCGWIPVSNGCPPYNPQADEVLAATITGHVVATHPSRIDMLYQDAQRNGEDSFYTHWMPMPKGPK